MVLAVLRLELYVHADFVTEDIKVLFRSLQFQGWELVLLHDQERWSYSATAGYSCFCRYSTILVTISDLELRIWFHRLVATSEGLELLLEVRLASKYDWRKLALERCYPVFDCVYPSYAIVGELHLWTTVVITYCHP